MNKELLNKSLNDLYEEHRCRLVKLNKEFIRHEVQIKFFTMCRENVDGIENTGYLTNEGESLSIDFITKIRRLLFKVRLTFNEDTEGLVDLQDFYSTVETDLKNIWRVRKSKASLKKRFTTILDQYVDRVYNDWDIHKKQYEDEFINWRFDLEEISELIYTNR
jgi:hypothetical protein